MKVPILVVLTFWGMAGMSVAGAQTSESMFDEASAHFKAGEYREAIMVYDDILEAHPENIPTLKMKGVAQSNLGYHERSMEQFFRILQYKPDDVHALAGIGVGMGYLGEYGESRAYFQRAIEARPDSTIIQNYIRHIDWVISKYPHTATEKPRELAVLEAATEIPPWVKENAGGWADRRIRDTEFVKTIEFLARNQIISPSQAHASDADGRHVPSWVRSNAGLWADGVIQESEFIAGLQFLISNGVIRIMDVHNDERTQEDLDAELSHFKRYLRSISKNVADEKRYIEFPNPSQDVIKKFMRDYVKWNFVEEAKRAATGFPDPSYEIIDGIAVIKYRVYVNEQPHGLPLDHVSTLKKSAAYWEAQELASGSQRARVVFEITDSRHGANVWVTWVVRDLGEGVLGHAHLGKGIVEVVLGDYGCDGSFQLYDIASVEHIMRHELGHSIGLTHASDPDNVMYPSYRPGYAYCLLG